MAVRIKRRLYGQRVPRHIRERFEVYAERKIEPDPSDTPEMKAEKARLEMQLDRYCALYHPLASPSARKTRKRGARYMTMQSAPEYIRALEVPFKTFFEFCLRENRDLNSPEDEGWKEIGWPTGEMAQMADILKDCTPGEKIAVGIMVETLEPSYYSSFRIRLKADSGENMPLGRPTASRTDLDEDIPELPKDENLGDRMSATVRYLCDESHEEVRQVCRRAGLGLFQKKTYASRHFWSVFRFGDIWEFCRVFRISPKWAMFGPEHVAVLADDEYSEEIMDDFMFLPAVRQRLAIRVAKNMLQRGEEALL